MDHDIIEELKNEAIDTIDDKIKSIEETLASFNADRIKSPDALASVKLDAHTIKSATASFEIKPPHVLSHRLEDFIYAEKELTNPLAKQLQPFMDRIAEVLDAYVNNREIDIAALMRRLPAKGGFDVSSVTVNNIEVMLVMEPGTANKIVTRELLECGYRMVNVASTMDAFQLIPAMRPDLVIVSRVMPELSGVDLVCALHAMPTTRKMPVALLASVDDDAKISDLPKGVPVLRKGSRFADDVADVFTTLGLL